MTRRILFTASLLAMAIAAAAETRAVAENNDANNSQSNAKQSNSGEHQAASNKSSSANTNSGNSANKDQQADKDNRSSSHDNTGKNAGDDRDRQNDDHKASRDNSNRDSDLDNDRGHESARDNQNDADRSKLNNENRSKDSARQSSDGEEKSRSTNQGDAQRDRKRDYRKDFKFGRANDHGLTLSSVTRSSIFYKSGLRDSDVIVSYNGHRIRSEDDFGRYVVYEQGRMPVVIYRNGREQTIYVVYDNQDDVAATHGDLFGAEFDQRSKNGAVIIRIEADSPADRAGLKRDDVVTAINGDRVSSGRDAQELLSSLKAGQRINVEYTRQGSDRQSRVKVTLGAAQRDTNVETTGYQADDHPTEAAGVQAGGTRSTADRDRRDNQDRRDDRRDNRGGLLPRLRN